MIEQSTCGEDADSGGGGGWGAGTDALNINTMISSVCDSHNDGSQMKCYFWT